MLFRLSSMLQKGKMLTSNHFIKFSLFSRTSFKLSVYYILLSSCISNKGAWVDYSQVTEWIFLNFANLFIRYWALLWSILTPIFFFPPLSLNMNYLCCVENHMSFYLSLDLLGYVPIFPETKCIFPVSKFKCFSSSKNFLLFHL